MKRLYILIVAIVAVVTCNTAKAGENDWHLFLSPNYFINPFARHFVQGGQIGFEKELSRRRLVGFSMVVRDTDLYNRGAFKTAEYSLIGYYKPSIYLGKNDNMYLSFGGNIGSARKGVTFGLNLAIEYEITLRNRLKFFIAQDNLLVFRSDNLLISGLSIGIKIPLTK